jgi:alpha-galactosidase
MRPSIISLPLLTALMASLSGTPRVTALADDQTWTIGNSRIQATLRLTVDGLVLDSVVDPTSGRAFGVASAPDSTVTINGVTSNPGSASGNWILQSADTSDLGNGTQLTFSFRSQKTPAVVERAYACYGSSPTLETWTTIRDTGSSPLTISNLNVWQLTVPAAVIHYSNGLRGDAAGADVNDAFTLQTETLGPREPLVLDEVNRSTEQYLPMIAADIPSGEFYGGLMWSGAWRLSAEAPADQQARILAGLPKLTTTIDASHPLESPHGFFGFTEGKADEVARALHQFVVQGLRQGRQFEPLVTDNTWFSFSTNIDEATIKTEMDSAASLGVELFVVDAGWYAGAGRDGDFESGLGSWRIDPVRFPHGLAPLRDYAHALGMKFGLWVEPERVNLSTVGKPNLAQNAFLAENNGKTGSSTMGQICLASPAARQWVLDRLTQLLDDVQPDYLKWDNNMWINCNRAGHGHGAADGNFAHVKGLYDVLQSLRDRYPDMTIENCASGGNRLDFGMLRYTDAAWTDDRSEPSIHVRHNLEGLSTFFPPAYLLSAMLPSDGEPLSDAPDLGLYLRSRMPGVLGFMYRSEDLSDEDRAGIAAEINVYKNLRDILRTSSAILLTPQASVDGGPAWDAIEALARGGERAVLFAFQDDGAVASVHVRPRGLRATRSYRVETVDGVLLRTATGADLMADGLDIAESPSSAARVVVLRGSGNDGGQ